MAKRFAILCAVFIALSVIPVVVIYSGNSRADTFATLKNVPYCTINGYTEYLDVTMPNSSAIGGRDEGYPAIVFVHGGGWVNGTKSAVWYDFPSLLTMHGFVYVSIGYYLPNNQMNQTLPAFPTNVEDVACAVRFLRAKAAYFHINPLKIGLAGESAGGQLVSLEALAAQSKKFDQVGQWLGYSSKVQAVSDAYGPSNLTDRSYTHDLALTSYGEWKINLTEYAFGGTTSNLISASPVEYATSSAPAFIIEQGWNDTIVPAVQSIMLYNKLRACGDNVTLVMVENSGHSFVRYGKSTMDPNISQIMNVVLNFFERTLES